MFHNSTAAKEQREGVPVCCRGNNYEYSTHCGLRASSPVHCQSTAVCCDSQELWTAWGTETCVVVVVIMCHTPYPVFRQKAKKLLSYTTVKVGVRARCCVTVGC